MNKNETTGCIEDSTEQKNTRVLTFRVIVPGEDRLIVNLPFETEADDMQINKLVQDQLRGLTSMRSVQRVIEEKTRRAAAKKGEEVVGEVRWLALYVRDLHTEEPTDPFIIPTILWTKDSLLENWILTIDQACEANVAVYYDQIERLISHWELSRETMTVDEWRAVCGVVHPLFSSSYWTERRRREFVLAAKEAIRTRRRRAAKAENNIGTEGVLSALSPDKTPSVQTSKKSVQKAVVIKAESVVASPRSKRGQQKQKSKAPRESKTRTIRQGATHDGNKEKPRSRN